MKKKIALGKSITKRLVSILLTLCMIVGLVPAYAVDSMFMAAPSAIKVELPAKFIEMQSTETLSITDMDGAPLSGANVTYQSSNTQVATVDNNGVITPISIGKTDITVHADFDGTIKTATVTVPVVGNNLLVINNVNHGAFEGGAYFNNITDPALTPQSDFLWRVNKDSGIYGRVEPEFVPESENMETYLKTGAKILRMRLPDNDTDAVTNSRMLFEVAAGARVKDTDPVGHISISADKLYEYTGWIKAENVPTGKVFPINTEVYFYNSLTTAGTALVTNQQINTTHSPWAGLTGNQDWTFFNTKPSILYKDPNDPTKNPIGANVRINQVPEFTVGDLYIADLSFHEVTFETLEFKSKTSVNKIAVGGNEETTFAPYTNTGNLIKPGYNNLAAKAIIPIKVTYSSNNDTVATVSETGVITGVADGLAKITATATINGVERSSTIDMIIGEGPSIKPDDLIYNFYKLETGNNAGVDVKTITDYKYMTITNPDELNPYVSGDKLNDATKKYSDPWKYLDVSKDANGNPTAKFFFASSAYGMMLDEVNLNGGGSVSYQIKVPTAGKYQPISRNGHWNSGAIVRVYIAPANVENPKDEKYSVGSIDTYKAETPAVWLQRDKLRTVDLLAGDYIVTYELVGTNRPAVSTAPARRFAVSALILQGMTKAPKITLSATAVSSDIVQGQKATSTLSATVEDGSNEDLSGLSIKAIPQNSSICSIEVKSNEMKTQKYLEITGLSAGSTTIDISALSGNIELAKTSITVNVKGSSGIIETVNASIKDNKTGRISNKTEQQVIVSLIDTDGNAIDISNATIEYAVSPSNIATIDQTGKLTALSNGNANVTVSATAKGNVKKSGTFALTVADSGENIFDSYNGNYESTDWLWDVAQGINTSSWRSLDVAKTPKDGNADNRALKIYFNKDAKVKSEGAFQFKGGSRIPLKVGHFYEMSFLVKIEDVARPANASADIALIPDMYAYNQISGGSLAGITYRNLEIHKIPDYLNKCSSWYRVSLEIAAPIDAQTAPGLEYVYASPRFSMTRSASTIDGQTGYGETVWFDDFELREVGFDHVELTREGNLNVIGDKATYTIKPVATTGTRIAMAAVAVPNCVKLTSSDEMIASVSAARPSTAGNNLLPTIADVTVNGKNGTAIISAEVTLNGVTRTVTDNITTTALPIVPYSASLELSKDTIDVSETANCTASAMLTDGSAANLADALVLYYTSNEDVATIDPVSGVIAGVGSGTADITVNVKMSGYTKTATKKITVVDNSGLKSAKLKAVSTEVPLNSTLALNIEAMMKSGQPANLTGATIVYSVIDGQDKIIVDNKGIVTGKIMGTASVKATVTIGEDTVETLPITLTVTNGAPLPVSIDLTKAPLADPKLLNEKNYSTVGWMIDEANTDPTAYGLMRYQGYGIQFQSANAEAKLTFKFKVPTDGNYAFSISGGNYKGGAEKANIYVDGSYIGTYNFFNINNNVLIGPTVKMKAMHYTAGDHILTLVPVGKGISSYNMYPGNLIFAGLTDLPEVTTLNVNVSADSLGVGETATTIASYTTSDDLSFDFSNKMDGSVDENAKITYTSSNPSVFSVNASGDITALAVGNAELIATATINGDNYEKRIPITVSNKLFSVVELALNETPLYVGQNTDLNVIPKFDDGSNVSLGLCSVEITGADNEFFTIDSKNVITAKKAGTAQVTVNVTFKGVTKTAILDITVEATKFESIVVTADRTYLKPSDNAAQITVSGRDSIGDLIDISGASFTYMNLNEDVVLVSGTGVVIPISMGTAKVEVTVTQGNRTAKGEITFVVTDGKTSSTFFTKEKVEAARENIKLYPWASALEKVAIKNADNYVGEEEKLWNLVTQEGLPRGITVGYQNDPNAYTCAYCGTDLRKEYGVYAWISEPLKNPWKIKCPNCRRLFPSNDFEKFYLSGINENGKFDIKLAKEKGQDYLKNVLYPEKDVDGVTNWGVDDGFGYKTGVTFSNGVQESKTFIAYYIHYGLWQKSGENNPGLLQSALNDLRNAYLYTGDVRYGRTGAILIDRVADVYPEFDLAPYYGTFYNSHGGGGEGKIIGRIWETGLATSLAQAYDAFYPMMDDPYVINFLNKKAVQYNIPNKKTSAKDIRDNCENGILRTIFDAAKKAQIFGNFGMHQSTVANAAVILDTMPETKEMIDWIYQDGSYSQNRCTGGNVNAQLVDLVSRDGLGNEAAPGYNRLWITNTMQIAEAMYGYEKYAAANLYNNPKFAKMFGALIPMTLIGRNTAQIGDSGATAGTGLAMEVTATETGFRRLGDPMLAKALYALNGDKVDGIHADIFTKNPEESAIKVQKIINEQGPLDLGSQFLTGEGFAILRDGKYLPSSVTTKVADTQRDFWIRNGRTAGHGHPDALNLGIEAYGINMAPDLGYPEATGSDPNRIQWQNTGLSHNTVTVNLTPPSGANSSGESYHFDDSGRVKVMDLSQDQVYTNIPDKIYRRTLVMVEASQDISYGIDFFRVKGGDDHIYSFHSQSNTIAETFGLKTKDQKRAVDIVDGKPVYEWIGSYAGPNVPWGVDTASNASSRYGTTWLECIRKDTAPKGPFSVDYKIDDFRNVLPYPMDLHLRVTMLNTNLNEVTLAKGTPPRTKGNPPKLEYLLARRTGTNLDTLFTTVFEPYKDQRYIESIESVDNMSIALAKSELESAYKDGSNVTKRAVINVASGTHGKTDTVRAVKVTLTGGRVDYVIYSTNNQVKYTVSELLLTDDNGNITINEHDLFDFSGFVGVQTMANEESIYTYLNDGAILGDVTAKPAITGTVTDFTKQLSSENYITISIDSDVDPAALVGKYIYINNDKAESGTYQIKGATAIDGKTIKLDIGNVTTVRAYKKVGGVSTNEYIYNIAQGQSYRIPLTAVKGSIPIFDPISNQVAEVASELKFRVHATSPSGNEIKYDAINLPRGAQFDVNTQTFSWTPDSGNIGDNHATIIASDGALSSVQNIKIKVYNQSNGEGPSGPIINPPNIGGNKPPVGPNPPSKTEFDVEGKLDSTKTAVATPSTEDIKKALNADTDNVTISIKDVKDAKGYGVKLPTSVLTNNSLDKEIVVSTPAGSIVLPTAILANDANVVSNKTATFTVTIAGTETGFNINTKVNGKDYSCSNPDAPVKVNANFEPSEDMKNVNCIIVKDENGNIIPNGKYDDGAVSLYTTTLNGEYTITYNEKTFNDLDGHKWADEAVTRLAAREIINGTGVNTYTPGKNITRADFTTLIVRTFGFEAESNASFSDVDKGAYYAEAVATAQALGIVGGANGKFNPKAEISREDMMVIIARAMDKTGMELDANGQTTFSDKSQVSGYATDAVNKLTASGIVAGSNGKLNPKGKTTRAEVAVLLDRLIFLEK